MEVFFIKCSLPSEKTGIFLPKPGNGKCKKALNPGNSRTEILVLNPNLFFSLSLLRTSVANQSETRNHISYCVTEKNHIITMSITHLFPTHTRTFVPQYDRKSRVKPGKELQEAWELPVGQA